MLISGRAARYEVGLWPILQGTSHDVDLFMAINGVDCEYYEIMKKRLSKWLRAIVIEPFVIDDGFCKIYKPEKYYQSAKQLINGKYVPYKSMSMYYHDHKAYNLANNYAEAHGLQYDTYMKFRSDIINATIPKDIPIDKHVLFSNRLICAVPSLLRKLDWVSDAWAWGDKEIMSVYCNTYSYVMHRNETENGEYYVSYEDSLTDNIDDAHIEIRRTNYPYSLDINRRIFDPYPNSLNGVPFVDIGTTDTLDNIPACKQE